jgi:DNA-binding NtrC family response regulator
VTAEAMDRLVRHPWPGNVRELANIVERLIILSSRNAIGEADVAAALPAGDGREEPLPHPAAMTLPLAEELDRFERVLITRALSAAGGSVAEAARHLTTDRANLYRRMKRLGIEPAS